MASVIRDLKRYIVRDQRHMIFECRRCGKELDPEDDVCPNCGSKEIASYELP